eukprot:GILK01009529.1.p1 GENE.GILK01009529.1~~GILK01009529.1.p1  ORF type:complete len:890 (-),score=210.60 GILK01009529.1:74-2455(-)
MAAAAKSGSWTESLWGGSKVKEEMDKLRQDLEVMTEELQVKIKENEEVHMEMFELRNRHKATVSQLETEIEQQRAELQTHSQEASGLRSSLADVEAERQRLTAHNNQLESKLMHVRAELEKRETQWQQTERHFQAELARLKQQFHIKVPFDDSKDETLNQLNMPPYDKALVKLQVDSSDRLQSSIQTVSTAVNAFFVAVQNRIASADDYPSQTEEPKFYVLRSKVVVSMPTFCSSLNSLLNQVITACTYYRSIRRFSDSQSESSSAEGIWVHLCKSTYNLYQTFKCYAKLKTLWLNEESSVLSHMTGIRGKNQLIVDQLNRLRICLSKVQRYLGLVSFGCIADLSDARHKTTTAANGLRLYTKNAQPHAKGMQFIQKQLFECTTEALQGLLELVKSWNGRLTLESTSSMKRYSQITVELNDQVVSSAAALVTAVSRCIDSFHLFYNNNSRVSASGTNSNWNQINKHRGYLSSIAKSLQSSPEPISFEESRRNKQQLHVLESRQHELNEELSRVQYQLQQSQRESAKTASELHRVEDVKATLEANIEILKGDLYRAKQKLSNGPASPDRNGYGVEMDFRSLSVSTVDDSESPAVSEDVKSFDAVILHQSHEELSRLPLTQDMNYIMKVTSADGSVGLVDSVLPSEDQRKADKELVSYLDNKLQQMNSQLQAADSRAIDLQAQLDRSKQTVIDKQKEQEALRATVDQARDTIANLQTEMDIWRQRFKENTDMLSEHAAQVAHELGIRDATLAAVQNHKVLCGVCKRWNTVGWLLQDGDNGKRCKGGEHPSSYNFG